MNMMRIIMSTLKERVVEAVDAAKERGYSIADIAKRCEISVQSIYQWLDPLNTLKELKASSLLGLAEISGFNPWYINDGVGDKVLYYAKNEPQKATLRVMEPMPLQDQAKMPRIGHSLIESDDRTNGTQ